jgi:GAF domain-containing protein
MASDLAALDRAAVFAYESQLSRTLADPERLREVYGTQFKAQSVQERLDTLCTVACNVLHTEGSSIHLVTDKEQIRIAMSPASENLSGDLDHSFCKYVVNEKAPFSVESASTHALVCTNKAVTDNGIVAYLGMPIVVHGFAVGALCVWETKERHWQPSDVTLLTTLASLASDTLNW